MVVDAPPTFPSLFVCAAGFAFFPLVQMRMNVLTCLFSMNEWWPSCVLVNNSIVLLMMLVKLMVSSCIGLMNILGTWFATSNFEMLKELDTGLFNAHDTG